MTISNNNIHESFYSYTILYPRAVSDKTCYYLRTYPIGSRDYIIYHMWENSGRGKILVNGLHQYRYNQLQKEVIRHVKHWRMAFYLPIFPTLKFSLYGYYSSRKTLLTAKIVFSLFRNIVFKKVIVLLYWCDLQNFDEQFLSVDIH